MRIFAVAPLAMLSALACADRLIDIPTASKVLFNDYRYEFRADPESNGGFENYLGLGVGKSFELDLRELEIPSYKQVGTFDFAYDYIAAIPDTSPGISFGVQDAANTTPDGRRFYAVTTFRNQVDVIGGGSDVYLSLGMQVGKLTSPFVGVSLPFSKQVLLVAEHSGYRLSAGIEVRPIQSVALRFVERGSSPLLSLSASGRF